MQDKYHVEWWDTKGAKVGMDISAYCSKDVLDFVEKLPNYNILAEFPTKTNADY